MIKEKSKNKLLNWEIVSVNPKDKNWDWKNLFNFWAVNIQSVIAFSLIASLYLVYELNVFIVFFGTLIGSLLVYFLANLIGRPSQKYGIPFPVLLRTSLGVFGAKYFAMLRGIVGIFMFGIQTYFLSKAFGYLIRIFLYSIDKSSLDHEVFLTFFFGLNIIDWFSFILTIFLQGYLFSKDFRYKKKIINLSSVVVYSGLLLFFLIVLLTDVKYVFGSFADIFIITNFFEKENLVPLITVAGTVFAYFSVLLVNFGDFSRFVKSEKELSRGNLSLLLNLIFFSFFAVFIVIGADVLLNKNLENMERILTNPTDIIGKFDNIEITIIVLFFILFASASTNLVANFVPTQNALLNFFPNKLSIISSTLIIIFLGFLVGIFWLPLFSQIGILSFIDTFAAFFGPMFGIIIIDYYVIKKSNLNNKDIYSLKTSGLYYFSGGWHIKAVYCIFLGFIFAAGTIWNTNLMYLQSYSWLIGAFVSSTTYYLLVNKN